MWSQTSEVDGVACAPAVEAPEEIVPEPSVEEEQKSVSEPVDVLAEPAPEPADEAQTLSENAVEPVSADAEVVEAAVEPEAVAMPEQESPEDEDEAVIAQPEVEEPMVKTVSEEPELVEVVEVVVAPAETVEAEQVPEVTKPLLSLQNPSTLNRAPPSTLNRAPPSTLNRAPPSTLNRAPLPLPCFTSLHCLRFPLQHSNDAFPLLCLIGCCASTFLGAFHLYAGTELKTLCG